MSTFEANRLSDGNKLFPAKISVDSFGVTLKIPGFLGGKEKSLSFQQISSVSIDSPMIGFSKITFNTLGFDRIVATGFSKEDAQEIRRLVQSGISGNYSNSGSSSQYSTNNTKDSSQILAEAEAERIKFEIESEKKKVRDEEDKAFFQAIVKNWKLILIAIVLLVVGLKVASYFNNIDKDKDRKLSNKLELIEDQIKIAIEANNKEEALKLANQLEHPSNEAMEFKKFDSWNGYPKYNAYWAEKREFYKSKILGTPVKEKSINTVDKKSKSSKTIEENYQEEEIEGTETLAEPSENDTLPAIIE